MIEEVQEEIEMNKNTDDHERTSKELGNTIVET